MGTHYQGKKSEIQALDTYVKLSRALDSFETRLQSGVSSVGLTSSQFGVLDALFHLGSLCQKELGEKILKTSGNMTMVIDNLEKRSLVVRERQEEDRRHMMVHLTAEGRALIAQLFPRHAAAVAREMAALSSVEQKELERLCKKLGTQLEP
jgi:MarR family 2-MHQ and catechol resistance regulon transcriptional repressor